MFELLVQVHVARGAMLSGPSCVDGQFLPSDNFVGNNDNDNKLKAKGLRLPTAPIYTPPPPPRTNALSHTAIRRPAPHTHMPSTIMPLRSRASADTQSADTALCRVAEGLGKERFGTF
jgi:hypothetical protein